MTAEVYKEICDTIGRKKPEQGGILGTSDGIHIDHYYYDKNARTTSGSYYMDNKTLDKVIAKWNDDGIFFMGVIHSHPSMFSEPSDGDRAMVEKIINSMNVNGEFFTPIVHVSPSLDGTIKIFPYSYVRNIDLIDESFSVEQSQKKTEKNIFEKISEILPRQTTKKKKVVVVGGGGSREFIETLARCGIEQFYIIEGDKVEPKNIATQGCYYSEIDSYKCDMIRKSILDINPNANVHVIKKYLDDAFSDNEFEKFIDLENTNKDDILLCGCTDNIIAQLRCEILGLKYKIPYLSAQIFQKGTVSEITFVYPGITESCSMCMLLERYKKAFSDPNFSQTGDSSGTPIYVTNLLNSVKSYFALCLLCYNEENTLYYKTLDNYKNKNYIMIKNSLDFKHSLFSNIDHHLGNDFLLPIGVVAAEQTPENDCPECAGNASEIIIDDTILKMNSIIDILKIRSDKYEMDVDGIK